jgi:hypothetical protein
MSFLDFSDKGIPDYFVLKGHWRLFCVPDSCFWCCSLSSIHHDKRQCFLGSFYPTWLCFFFLVKMVFPTNWELHCWSSRPILGICLGSAVTETQLLSTDCWELMESSGWDSVTAEFHLEVDQFTFVVEVYLWSWSLFLALNAPYYDIMTESSSHSWKCDKKFKDAEFCTIVLPKFEQIITTYQHPLLGGWESQWRVMAASHRCSWWRWWSCTVSETQKVMAKLILVIFVLFGQIWCNILSSGYCNVIWSFLFPFSIDIAFLLNYASLLMSLTCSFFILIVMGAITSRQADVLSWQTFDKGLLVLCLHSIKSIAWTFMFELFLYKMCLRL